MRSSDRELPGITPQESERLKQRFDAWREAQKRIEPAARGEEPLSSIELEPCWRKISG